MSYTIGPYFDAWQEARNEANMKQLEIDRLHHVIRETNERCTKAEQLLNESADRNRSLQLKIDVLQERCDWLKKELLKTG